MLKGDLVEKDEASGQIEEQTVEERMPENKDFLSSHMLSFYETIYRT